MRKNLIFHWPIYPIAVSICLVVGCLKPPDYTIEPAIQYTGLSKKAMKQRPLGADSIQMAFSFTDGDGDISFEDGSNSIKVIDSRDSSEKEFGLPFIGTQGTGQGISGDITLILTNTCCIFVNEENIKLACENVPVQYDTLFYYIELTDRAGHKSNRIQTEPIVLQCK